MDNQIVIDSVYRTNINFVIDNNSDYCKIINFVVELEEACLDIHIENHVGICAPSSIVIEGYNKKKVLECTKKLFRYIKQIKG